FSPVPHRVYPRIPPVHHLLRLRAADHLARRPAFELALDVPALAADHPHSGNRPPGPLVADNPTRCATRCEERASLKKTPEKPERTGDLAQKGRGKSREW